MYWFSSRTLRSSGTGLLIIPQAKAKTQCEASFYYYSPTIVESVPEDLRAADGVPTFRSQLKTHLLHLAFNGVVFVLVVTCRY